MSHPLACIPAPARRSAFFGLLAWTLVLFACFQFLNRPLVTSAAPFGIVSHQLAWTTEKARAIISSWDPIAREFAAFGLGLDYLFMPSYGLAVALGSLLAAGRHPGWFARLGVWTAWAVFAAVLFDAIENAGQLVQLLGGSLPAWLPLLVGVCATLKFSLLILCILYGLAGWLLPKF